MKISEDDEKRILYLFNKNKEILGKNEDLYLQGYNEAIHDVLIEIGIKIKGIHWNS